MSGLMPIPEHVNKYASEIVDAAYMIHRSLGPGLLEMVYHACLAHELSSRRVPFESQVTLPIIYEGIRLDAGLRVDLWVDRCLIVELKAVEALLPVHQAQLMTYLKLTGSRLGLLINFNVPVIREGIRRLAL